jgi:hypothetical protein
LKWIFQHWNYFLKNYNLGTAAAIAFIFISIETNQGINFWLLILSTVATMDCYFTKAEILHWSSRILINKGFIILLKI